jgi:hypothetical protein
MLTKRKLKKELDDLSTLVLGISSRIKTLQKTVLLLDQEIDLLRKEISNLKKNQP